MTLNRRKLTAFAVSTGMLMLSVGHLQAQTIGKTLQTTNVVLGSQNSGRYARLKIRDAIFRDQYIQTRASSIGQFEFDDGTALAVGPRATIQLNEAVYGGPQSHQLLSGTLRFVTNSVASDFDTVITTPVATIGVRGTIFDVFVDALTGATAVLLVKGGPANVCAGGICKVLRSVCDVIEVRSGGSSPSDPQPVSDYLPSRPATEAFPFAARSFRTRSVFRVGANNCKLTSGRAWNRAFLDSRDPDDRDSFPDDMSDDEVETTDVATPTPDPATPNTPDPGTPNTPDPGTPNTPDPGTPNTPDPGTPNNPGRNPTVGGQTGGP